MILYSQQNGAWSGHTLGWGPRIGSIGNYGCFETCFAMILTDSCHATNPAALDKLLTDRHLFMPDASGTHDFLATNTLDLLFPGEYHTSQVAGFDVKGIARAVPTSDIYTILFISTNKVHTHFVIALKADGSSIADPWTGSVVSLAGYGGRGAIKKTIYIRHVKPGPVSPQKPPPQLDPLPVPTPPVYNVYSFLTGTDNHPPDQTTTEADAISQADDWSSRNDSTGIKVYLGNVITGTVVYDLPSNVVPRI